MKQQNQQYVKDDHERWSCLMKKKTQLLHQASDAFLRGFEIISLPEDRIPELDEINSVLQPLTGWRYEVSPPEADTNSFFLALSKRVFLSAPALRSWDELNFCKLPDIFHDVFGHAALLTDAPFADFLEELGKLGVKNKSDAGKMKFLSSIYWYTAEVGLIYENNTLKYYGGSIISSASEIETVYKKDSVKQAYSTAMVGQTPYDSYVVNSNYFIVNSLTDLNQSIQEIRQYTENGITVHDKHLSRVEASQ